MFNKDDSFSLKALFTSSVYHLVWELPPQQAPSPLQPLLRTAMSAMEVQNMFHSDSVASSTSPDSSSTSYLFQLPKAEFQQLGIGPWSLASNVTKSTFHWISITPSTGGGSIEGVAHMAYLG